MGVTVELLLDGDPPGAEEAFAAAEREIHRLERVFSRFLPDSELSALNAAGSLRVCPELLEVTERAVAAREQTGGRFDPTVHDAVVAAGYDRSFEQVAADAAGPVPRGAACGGSVAVEPDSGWVRLGPGTRLDLGGIAKGYAADRACDLLGTAGSCVVNAGGDVAVRGLLGGSPWPIGVDVAGKTLTLGLCRGALATSGSDHRRWRRGDADLHHLIDPATGLPSSTDLVRVTAFAETAAEAEVRAKALFLAGEHDARAEADALGIPAVLVTCDERVVLAGGLA